MLEKAKQRLEKKNRMNIEKYNGRTGGGAEIKRGLETSDANPELLGQSTAPTPSVKGRRKILLKKRSTQKRGRSWQQGSSSRKGGREMPSWENPEVYVLGIMFRSTQSSTFLTRRQVRGKTFSEKKRTECVLSKKQTPGD